jgi:hypothetical protein
MITAESILTALKPHIRIDSHDDHALALIAVQKLIAAEQASDAALVKRMADVLSLFDNHPVNGDIVCDAVDAGLDFYKAYKNGGVS